MKFINNTHCGMSFLLPCPDLFITCHICFRQILRNALITPQNSHTLQSTFCLIITTFMIGSLIQFEVMYTKKYDCRTERSNTAINRGPTLHMSLHQFNILPFSHLFLTLQIGYWLSNWFTQEQAMKAKTWNSGPLLFL